MKVEIDFWKRMQKAHIVFFLVCFALSFLLYNSKDMLNSIMLVAISFINLHLVKEYDQKIIDLKEGK